METCAGTEIMHINFWTTAIEIKKILLQTSQRKSIKSCKVSTYLLLLKKLYISKGSLPRKLFYLVPSYDTKVLTKLLLLYYSIGTS